MTVALRLIYAKKYVYIYIDMYLYILYTYIYIYIYIYSHNVIGILTNIYMSDYNLHFIDK